MITNTKEESYFDESEGYIQFEKPNKALVSVFLEECKGNRRWYPFEQELKADPECPSFGTLRYGVKWSMPYALITTVIKHAAPESKVTVDQLMAANGYIWKSELDRVLYSLQPQKKDKKDLREKRWYSENPGGKTVLAEPPFHEDSYDEFISDYAVFAEDLVNDMTFENATSILTDMKHMAKTIYDNKMIVRMLHRYVYQKHDVEALEERNQSQALLLDKKEANRKKTFKLSKAYMNVLIHLLQLHV